MLLRTAAILTTLVLLASFSLFAIDQAGGASQQAQIEVAGAGGQTLGPALKGVGAERGVRGTIDDVNRVLVGPVASLAPGTPDSWDARGFELACGLLVYCLILGMIARSASLAGHRHRHRHGDAEGALHKRF